MPQMQKALFIWNDGHRDYAEVFVGAQRWKRPILQEVNAAEFYADEEPCIFEATEFRTTIFKRVNYSDGSFEYREE